MWSTPDGRVHTVAVPDPASLVRLVVVGRGDREVRPEDVAVLQPAVEPAMDEALDAASRIPFDAETEATYHAQMPAPLVLELDGSDPARLAASLLTGLAGVDARWRLDYVMALEDLLDEHIDA